MTERPRAEIIRIAEVLKADECLRRFMQDAMDIREEDLSKCVGALKDISERRLHIGTTL